MEWRKGRSGGIEDRRGGGGPAMAGGGIVAVIIGLIGYYFFGLDPNAVMNVVNQVQGDQTAQVSKTDELSKPEDEQALFLDVVHTSANDVWTEIFAQSNKTYRPSILTLYSQGTNTGCGFGQAAAGPFYCPADDRVYMDTEFFKTLSDRLGARGDFAMAYVVAHEVGHHVQNVLGVSAKVQARQQSVSKKQANLLSVRLELQADCYAGVWAKKSNTTLNWLEAGDLEEAFEAASAVGDDTLQKNATGTVNPDGFTHGSAAQRLNWFKRGFETGSPDQCDTFTDLS